MFRCVRFQTARLVCSRAGRELRGGDLAPLAKPVKARIPGQQYAPGRIAALLLSCWLGIAFAEPEVDRTARFTNVGDAASIPDGVVTALAQDARGLMWIGTTRGLVRFDGYEYKRFVAHAGEGHLGGNLVRSLLLASDGRLWIGLDSATVSVYDPVTDRFSNFRPSSNNDSAVASASVMALVEAADGTIYGGTRGIGVMVFERGASAPTLLREGQIGQQAPRSDLIHALSIDANGDLWIGSYAGLRRRRGNGVIEDLWSMPGVLEQVAVDPIFSLLDSGERLWIGTQGGRLAFFDKASSKVALAQDSEVAARPGMLDTIADLERVSDDEVWLARSSGIEVRDLATGALRRWIGHEPERASSLGGSDIRAVLRARDGLIWVGGFGSGVQWHDPASRWLAVLKGEPGFGGVFANPNVSAIEQRRSGEIWLGTRGKGIAVLDSQLNLQRGFKPGAETGLAVAWITALTEDEFGAMWIGSRDGVHRYAGERFERFGVEAGLTSLSVRRLSASSGELWIGTSDGAFVGRVGGQTIALSRIAQSDGSALSGEVNAFAHTPDGRTWMGGNAGLYVGTHQGVAPVSFATGASTVLGLLLDRGTLWIDTDIGLHRLDAGSSVPVSIGRRLDVDGDFGANLLADEQGRIWTHRYIFEPGSDRVYPTPATLATDFGTGWFRSYDVLADGRFLFGGSRGLLVIRPDWFAPEAFEAEVIATSIQSGERSLPLTTSSLELTSSERNLSVTFAAIDYRRAGTLRYRYRLAGVDANWVEVPPTQRVAVYRNLAPGNYRFAVQADDGFHGYGKSALQLDVTVQPTFWQRGWVQALALLAFVGTVALGVRVRFALLRQQALELERLVAQRTDQLSQSKLRAEQALHDLEMAKDHLVQSEKLASLGRLVAGVAHEINTPLGVAVTAVSRLGEINSEAWRALQEGRMTKGELKRWQEHAGEGQRLTQQSLDRASRLVGSFKRMAVDQSSEERRRFDLALFLDEVRTTFQPSFRSTPHVLNIDAPSGIVLDSYPGALFQIFTNLVENAMKHAFTDDMRGQLSIEGAASGDEVVIYVSDNGRGIPDGHRAKVFEPFFTTRRDQGGSGLGLHLVHNLTTGVLGGVIDIVSISQGTRFCLRIPRVAPSASVGTQALGV